MIWNYLKIAFRKLYRQNGYSMINIIGLAIGISCTILMSLWILDELSYDRFLDDNDQIFGVREHQEYATHSIEAAVTPGRLAALKGTELQDEKRGLGMGPAVYIGTLIVSLSLENIKMMAQSIKAAINPIKAIRFEKR